MLLAVLTLHAAPAHAEEYSDVLDRLGRLQDLANTYVAEQDTSADPIVLTLAYTRVGDYNTSMWQLTAGARDADFENYVNAQDSDLVSLQGLNTVTLPNGQAIDFGHLLASMNLVYNGLPITGSWGGDCMELAQTYQGQASDRSGYASLMRETFNMADDGTLSSFGDQDLRADLDSVNVGSQLTADTDIADTLRIYYESLTDYDRAYNFIAVSFGSVDTASGFGDVIYNAVLDDSGMQLLLYMNGMWTKDSWTVDANAAPALQGACDLLAEYLAGQVNNGKVKSESNSRLVAMGGAALADALNTLGDSDAADAVLSAANGGTASSSEASSTVVADATQTLQNTFNLRIFELILLIFAAVAVFCLIMSTVLFFVRRKKK